MAVFTNARIFDGREMLAGTHDVTLDGNRIASIDEHGGARPGAGDVVDLGGMTLMPGLITCHLHPDFYKFDIFAGEKPGKELPPGVMMAIGVRTCRVLLESGFTGYVGAACAHDIDAQLKMAIAEDIIPGPRIRACGHHIGTTGDMNNRSRWWKPYETPGLDLLADGPDGLRDAGPPGDRPRRRDDQDHRQRRARRSPDASPATWRATRSPRSSTAAHERGAKVRAHVADKEMILECIELGVDIIDHGDEIDEECIERMVEAGTFWVPSLVYLWSLFEVGYAERFGVTRAVYDHVRAMLPVAQQAGVRILIGDDYSGVFRTLLGRRPARPRGRQLRPRVRLLRGDRRPRAGRHPELGHRQRRAAPGRPAGEGRRDRAGSPGRPHRRRRRSRWPICRCSPAPTTR